MADDMSSPPNRTRGLLIALAGVMAVSPDAMLLRSMRAAGASLPDVAGAKYFCIWLFFVGLTIRSPDARAAARRAPGHFIASAACQLCNQLGFTFSLMLTDAAKALLLISLTPLWAALIGWLCLGDQLPRRTLVSLALSIVSVGMVFVPRAVSLLADAAAAADGEADAVPEATHGHGTLFGDMLALFTGVAQAASISVNRHAALHNVAPGAISSTMLSTGLSSACAFIVALSLPCDPAEAAALGEVPGFWACTPKVFASAAFLGYAVTDATCVACTYVAMTIAPRHITGSEVALILLLEDITGPLWVFCRFGDVPSPWTVGGGVLLLATLVGHEVAGWSSEQQQAAIAPARETEDRDYHRLAGK